MTNEEIMARIPDTITYDPQTKRIGGLKDIEKGLTWAATALQKDYFQPGEVKVKRIRRAMIRKAQEIENHKSQPIPPCDCD